MTIEKLMSRFGKVVPADRRLDFEGDMASMIEEQKLKASDPTEATRRIVVIARSKARNACRDGQRKTRRQKSLDVLRDRGFDRPSAVGEPGEELEIAEVVAKIDENLTADERRMARLFREGATVEGAAEELELPRETVRDQWKTLQTKMRRLMERYS